ncbi:MAG: hypothetical protein JO224_04590 [Pelomonas sp.]|nr:hypothetical protein [Roseateles sp.]
MIDGAEGALLGLALALYLFDAAQWLGADEWLLEQRHGGRWFARFGVSGWRLAHREFCLPNPLAPWRPLLRLRWRFETGPEDAAAVSAPPALPGVGLRVNAALLLVLIFGALPIALLGYPLLWLKLGAALAIYMACGVHALLLWRERERLGLDLGECAKLALECIACPPFALNLVRKLGLRARVASGTALEGLLAPDERRRALQAMLVRLREQLDVEPEGTPRMAQLRATAARLEQRIGTTQEEEQFRE